MPSISLSILVGLASLLVITVSAVLQYISHRHNVVDTRFEREQKIKTNLGTDQIEVEEFTENEYDISIRLSDVDVRERTGRLYRWKKLLFPTADIDGTTVAKMEVKPDHNIAYGLYEIEGFKDEYGGLRGVFLSSRGE